MNTLALMLTSSSVREFATTMRHPLVLPLLVILAIVLAALLAVRLTLRRSVKRMTELMRRIRTGHPADTLNIPQKGILAPLVKEASTLAQNLSQAEEAAK